MSESPKDQSIPDDAALMVAYVHREGERRRAELEEQAHLEMARIREEAELEKEQLLAEGRAEFRVLESEIRSSEVGRAKWAAKSDVQRAVGKGVDRLVARAEERMAEFAASPQFGEYLTKLILEAVHCAQCFRPTTQVEGGLGTIRVNSRDADLCRRILTGRGLVLKVQADEEVDGGAIVEVADSNYRVINTLTSRLEKKNVQLRAIISKRIHDELVQES